MKRVFFMYFVMMQSLTCAMEPEQQLQEKACNTSPVGTNSPGGPAYKSCRSLDLFALSHSLHELLKKNDEESKNCSPVKVEIAHKQFEEYYQLAEIAIDNILRFREYNNKKEETASVAYYYQCYYKAQALYIKKLEAENPKEYDFILKGKTDEYMKNLRNRFENQCMKKS